MAREITIARYRPDKDVAQWNSFAAAARQGCFLFQRGYMDYHADRFEDFSLIARRADGKPLAMLPACVKDSTLFSHSGLTFGGWLTPQRHFELADMVELFGASSAFLRAEGIDTLVYKPSPYIYHSCPADDDLYALWRFGAQMTACQASTAYRIEQPRLLNMSTRQNIRRAASLGVTVEESHDYAGFWKILTEVLDQRHGVAPVHTLEEMELLVSRFPDNIRLLTASLGGEVMAGTVVYINPGVIHTQYMATTAEARRLKILPLLVDSIPSLLGVESGWVDFGSSCEDGGRMLNTGLDALKEGLGGRPVIYPAYTLPLR